jgi:hypothetical protein
LVVWSRKKERERSIYFTAIIHWLSDRKKNGKESTDADDMFFYIRSSFLFLPLFLFFCIHEFSKITTKNYSPNRK